MESNSAASIRVSPEVRILDDQVVNQIAAGEVVERPASVVKELVENALDAGATNISVSLSNGGRTLIEVTDDGCGMNAENAARALERFGTSKIVSTDDLVAIATHGFRGEAIPSIASVSRFTLTTAPEGEEGVEIIVEGGKVTSQQKRALQRGTKISVRNLFFNVPARRAFLKSERTEEGFVRSLLYDFAAGYPHVRLRLTLDGEESLILPPNDSLTERLKSLQLVPKNGVVLLEERVVPEGVYRVEGIVSRPEDAVRGSSKLRLLVNRRSVRDKVFLRAVRDGFGNFLRGEQYPTGIVRLELPPAEVDVNVHPQKTEVRFRNPDRVFSIVHRAISKALEDVGAVPRVVEALSPEPWSWNNTERSSAPVEFFGSGSVTEASSPAVADHAPIPAVSFRGTPVDLQTRVLQNISSLKYLGQLFDCYLLFEWEGQCIVIDMHAAHERVRFFELKSELLRGTVREQLLMIPEVFELPPEDWGRFSEFRPHLKKLGLECEEFGQNQVVVRSVPVLLGSVSPRQLIADLLSLPESTRWDRDLERSYDAAIARMACHSAVRSGHKLGREEAFHLLERMKEAQMSAFCPHGRPVMISLSESELEVRFGRQ